MYDAIATADHGQAGDNRDTIRVRCKSSGPKVGIKKTHYPVYAIRVDGSRIYARVTAFFPLHDLLRYAAGTTFGFTNAFRGLVASGRVLDDFSAKNPATGKGARVVPAEAMPAHSLPGAKRTGK